MPLLEQVLEKYPTEVKLVYKNFPLRMHPYSTKAAAAAMAAAKQGKFWEMYHKIFSQYNQLTDEKLEGFAKEIGLDMKAFAKDRKSPDVRRKIQLDMQEGSMIGVRGTPTIFINGRRLRQRSLQGFSAKIDALLKKEGKR